MLFGGQVMKDEIAKRVQRLRKDAAMTQMELSRGICTQAQISNIEKGHLNPSSLTLFQISQKLNVDMNYFFCSLRCASIYSTRK